MPLASLAGKYRCDLYGEIEAAVREGRLSLKLGMNPAVKLEHWQDDAFISPSPEADAPWFDWLIQFRIGRTASARRSKSSASAGTSRCPGSSGLAIRPASDLALARNPLPCCAET